VKSIASGQHDTAPTRPAARVRLGDIVEVAEHGVGIGAVVKQRRDHHRPRRFGRELFEERNPGMTALGEHEQASSHLLQGRDQRAQLLVVGKPRGHRQPALAVVRRRGAGREADRASAHRLEEKRLHGVDLARRGGAAGGRFAHHVGAQRRMPREHRYVHRRALALEHVEVLRHRFEVPADPLAQDFERHAFHLGEVPHHELAVTAAAGCDGEAAVADHRSGHAELGRGRYARSQVIWASQ
jgi:hypothetical protein